MLEADDLNAHFQSQLPVPDGPTLLKLARQIVSRWASTRAHEIALHSHLHWDGPTQTLDDIFSAAEDSDSDSNTPLAARPQCRNSQLHSQQPRRKDFKGDHVLANSILRLRDSLWHYEFIWATADGDIGRTMQIMAVSIHHYYMLNPIWTPNVSIPGLAIHVPWR